MGVLWLGPSPGNSCTSLGAQAALLREPRQFGHGKQAYYFGKAVYPVPLRRNSRRVGLSWHPRRDSRLISDGQVLEAPPVEAQELAVSAPLWRQILAFAVPVSALTLADPLMGLVDAICVGRSCSSLELAALGPNLTIFNLVAYGFIFLPNVATLLTSEAFGSNASNADSEAEQAIWGCFLVALCAGSVVAGLLFCRPQAMLGATGAMPQLLAPASGYCRLRALAVPGALMSSVLQAGLLGQQDVSTPLKAILASLAVNAVGDFLLVCCFGLGLEGTAWATLLGTWVGTLLLVSQGYSRRPVKLRPTRGSRLFWRGFLVTALPIAMFAIFNNATFALIQAAATKLDVMSCAAHQPVWAIWSVTCMATFPLHQATQVFLPRLVQQKARAMDLLRLLLQMALALGFALGAVNAVLAGFFPGALVQDATLWPSMHGLAVPAFVSMLVAGSVQVLDGVLLATKESNFLAVCQAVNLGVAFLGLRYSLSAGFGLAGIWSVLTAAFIFRLLQDLVKLRLMPDTV